MSHVEQMSILLRFYNSSTGAMRSILLGSFSLQKQRESKCSIKETNAMLKELGGGGSQNIRNFLGQGLTMAPISLAIIKVLEQKYSILIYEHSSCCIDAIVGIYSLAFLLQQLKHFLASSIKCLYSLQIAIGPA